MKKYRDYDVVVDYTSGTKTMTSAAFVMAILYRKEVSVVSGFRDKNGTVQRGTEQVITQNMYQVYDKLSISASRIFSTLAGLNSHRCT